MKKACELKFRQNSPLLDHLITSQVKLGEASYDRFWGIGLGLHDINAWCPALWGGVSVLGSILEQLRNTIIQEVLEKEEIENADTTLKKLQQQ